MNIGLFGGTFDPIHRGHLALARAARERYNLGRILFVPANVPPHKQSQPLSAFSHRYAMIALATSGEKDFCPSVLEAPEEALAGLPSGTRDKVKEIKPKPGQKNPSERTVCEPKPNYTIDTVQRLKQSFKKADRLFFLIGIDAFKDIAQWHQAEALFQECEFVVASRPGYSLADVANTLPERLRPRAEATKPFQKQAATGDLVLSGVSIHFLEDVYQPVSSTAIRQAIIAGKPLGKFLDPAVADYIKKTGLYKNGA